MENEIGKYLSKGLDIKAAEYFANGRRKAVDAVANCDFTLTVTFDNGERRLYDVRPLLEQGTVFEHIIKFDDFRRVYVDKLGCISWDINSDVDSERVWSNKIDIDADSCYIDSVPV